MKINKKKDYYELDIGISKSTFLALILVFASLVVNIYYFSINTGLWWDEAEYLSFVNHVVKGSPYSMWGGRAIFYPLLLSVFGFLSTSESFLRVALILISCLTIFFSYKVLEIFFKEKIAFIASLLFLTSPLFSFFSLRFLTDIPGLLFTISGLYLFFIPKFSSKNRIIAGLLIGCAVAVRFTSIFIVPALLLHELLSRKDFKSYVWVPALLLAFVPTMIFDVVNGNPFWATFFTFITQSTAERSTGHNLGEWYYYLITWPSIIGSLTIVFVALGLLYFFSELKGKNKAVIIMILAFMALHFFSYSFLTQLKEERYIIPILPFVFASAAFGIIIVSDTVAKFFKKKFKLKFVNYIIIGLSLFMIIIPNLSWADSSIKYSSRSYENVKLAGEYVKGITFADEIIITNSAPHVAYSSERETIGFPENMSLLYSLLDSDEDVNIIILSFYETLPSYINEFYNNTRFALIEEFIISEEAPPVIVLGYLRD